MAASQINNDEFDANFYLQTRYGKINQAVLGEFHHLFQLIKKKDFIERGELKVLDYGSGPVVQHGISVAPLATEIVFSDFIASNREATQKWLSGDADAFDWSPHFNYVVKTLEGKGEKEVREREQRVRQISKVVHCNALSETPMQKGYEGPYDVIIQCGCLEAACSSKDSYEKCMKTVFSLLKPGGLVVNSATNGKDNFEDLTYLVGQQNTHNCIRLTAKFVELVFSMCGLVDVHTTIIPFSSETWRSKVFAETADGYHFIYGTKPK